MSPVTSYGMIAVRYPEEGPTKGLFSSSIQLLPPSSSSSPQFLLIRRKDSLSFIEFIRGKFSYMDEEYIAGLLRNMTQSEQGRLLCHSFESLWNQIWGEASSSRSHKNNYEASERRFQQLQEILPRLVRDNPSPWTEPEWGFPKGRRNPHETDIHCAIREFQEETGLRRHEFQVFQNVQEVSETFFGSNHVHYCHKYYLAVCPPQTEVIYHPQNVHMFREIGDIRWCTLEEAMTRIRPDNVEKRELLLKAGKILKNFYPVITF